MSWILDATAYSYSYPQLEKLENRIKFQRRSKSYI